MRRALEYCCQTSEIVLIKLPGDGEPDRSAALGDGLRPGLYVGTIVDGQVVDIRAGRDAIELDEVDAPGSEQIDDGVDVFLRTGLGEVDFVVVGIGQGSCECVALGERHDHDVLRVIGGAEDGVVAVDGGLFDAGNPVDASLLAVCVDVVDESFHVGKCSGVRDWSAIGVEAALPSRVDVDIAEAMLLESGGLECVGLGLDVGLGEKAAVNRLFAEGAPAKIGSLADTVRPGRPQARRWR